MAVTISGTTGVSLVQDGVVGPTDLTGNQAGAAPIYGCRAWVAFDGTKDTTGAVSTANTNRLIRASGNVTSVLRNGLGDYTVTFTTAMDDANYGVVTSLQWTFTGTTQRAASLNVSHLQNPAASNVRVLAGWTGSGTSGSDDSPYCYVAIFR